MDLDRYLTAGVHEYTKGFDADRLPTPTRVGGHLVAEGYRVEMAAVAATA